MCCGVCEVTIFLTLKLYAQGGRTSFIDVRTGTKYCPQFQLEWATAPFGLRDTYKENASADFWRFNCEMSLDQETPQGQSMIEFFDNMDEVMLENALANAKTWFPKIRKEVTMETLRAKYRSTVQRSEKYNPLVRVKLQHGGPAKSQTRVWKYTETKTGEEIALRCDSSGNPYTLECIDTKFVPVRAIVRASGLWFMNDNLFGVALVATDIMFRETESKRKGFSPFTTRTGDGIRSVASAAPEVVDFTPDVDDGAAAVKSGVMEVDVAGGAGQEWL